MDLGGLDRRARGRPGLARPPASAPATTGPALEDELREHGLTLRHYPQSFELATLGGWIATRAGGHFATGPTHIDDLVESVRALTPRGRVGEPPAARLGRRAQPRPDADRLRGDPRRDHRGLGARPAAPAVQGVGRRWAFTSFGEGAAAVRALAQSGLDPANCRLLDPGEAGLTGAGDGETAVLVLGFESADHPLDAWLDAGAGAVPRPRRPRRSRAARPRDRGGARGAPGPGAAPSSQAPYLRDTMVAAGVLSETFETAITWDRFDAFVAEVRERAERRWPRSAARAG